MYFDHIQLSSSISFQIHPYLPTHSTSFSLSPPLPDPFSLSLSLSLSLPPYLLSSIGVSQILWCEANPWSEVNLTRSHLQRRHANCQQLQRQRWGFPLNISTPFWVLLVGACVGLVPAVPSLWVRVANCPLSWQSSTSSDMYGFSVCYFLTLPTIQLFYCYFIILILVVLSIVMQVSDI